MQIIKIICILAKLEMQGLLQKVLLSCMILSTIVGELQYGKTAKNSMEDTFSISELMKIGGHDRCQYFLNGGTGADLNQSMNFTFAPPPLPCMCHFGKLDEASTKPLLLWTDILCYKERYCQLSTLSNIFLYNQYIETVVIKLFYITFTLT